MNDRAGKSLRLQILPLRSDAPLFIEKEYWPAFPQSGQVDELKLLKLNPEYQLIVDSGVR